MCTSLGCTLSGRACRVQQCAYSQAETKSLCAPFVCPMVSQMVRAAGPGNKHEGVRQELLHNKTCQQRAEVLCGKCNPVERAKA